MRALMLGLMATLSVHIVCAQKSPVKFGDIPLEDLKMKVYDKDSSASAVILVDYGEAYVSVTAINATLVFERHVRIKILTKEGMSWADADIPLYHSGSAEERVTKLKATTYNLENGKIVETDMSKDGIFKEKFNRNINLQKFTLPNVKEGSVIEYSYTVTSEFLTNFPNWQFQYDIPVRWSEYWAMFPEFFFFEKYMQGYIAPTSYEVKNKANTDFQVQAHHWISKDVPAFKEEPFMTCEDDYVSKINLALSHVSFPGQPVREIMGTWSKLNTLLLESEDFGKAVSGSNFLKKKVEEITAGLTDPQQKTARDHGFVRQPYPMEEQFNYVICTVKIGDKRLTLDATDKYLPIGILPERCLNGPALIISKTNHGWINVDAKTKSRTVVSTDLTLKESGELTGKVNYTFDGYDAHRVRKDYFAKGETDYLKKFMEDKTWEIQKSEFQNLKEIDQNAKQLHELIINEHCTLAGNVIYLNPYVTSQLKENVFKHEKREYPVDFGSPADRTYMCKIVLPEGYTVDELPKPKIIVLPGNAAKFSYNISQTGNVLNVISMLQINKALFLQDEYPHLREFYNQVVAKQSEQIVLKRK